MRSGIENVKAAMSNDFFRADTAQSDTNKHTLKALNQKNKSLNNIFEFSFEVFFLENDENLKVTNLKNWPEKLRKSSNNILLLFGDDFTNAAWDILEQLVIVKIRSFNGYDVKSHELLINYKSFKWTRQTFIFSRIMN